MSKIAKKKMRKFLLLSAFIMLSQLPAKAQDYNTGIGVKIGGGVSGISLKHFVSGSSAVEVIAGSRWSGIQILALYEIHAQAFDVHGLYWYYGIGGHIGFWEGHKHSPFDEDEPAFVGIGVDGVLGMEYKIENIPITVSLDVVPTFNIAEHPGFWMDAGIGLRYVF